MDNGVLLTCGKWYCYPLKNGMQEYQSVERLTLLHCEEKGIAEEMAMTLSFEEGDALGLWETETLLL